MSYALYSEEMDGSRKFFTNAPDEQRAKIVARFSSKYGTLPVIVMRADKEIVRYVNGRVVNP
jgi:hypothetical protein